MQVLQIIGMLLSLVWLYVWKTVLFNALKAGKTLIPDDINIITLALIVGLGLFLGSAFFWPDERNLP